MKTPIILYRVFLCCLLALLSLTATSQELTTYPTISPSISAYSTEESDSVTLYPGDADVKSFDAPVDITLHANPENAEDYNATYEWHFYKDDEGSAESPLYKREGATWTEHVTTTGTFCVVLYAYFKDADGNILYEYGEGNDPIMFDINQSKLEFPNAFSPNGDGINDYYGAKSNGNCDCRGKSVCIHRGQSIVKFHADIFSRWGQRLYSWDDVSGSWDGTYNGHKVKNGVYFVHVEAEGADGKTYSIKRDVNVLTGFTEKDSTSSN